jgi:hypothetical protein
MRVSFLQDLALWHALSFTPLRREREPIHYIILLTTSEPDASHLEMQTCGAIHVCLQTVVLTRDNNLCSHEKRVFANIPCHEKAKFWHTIICITKNVQYRDWTQGASAAGH